MEQLEKEARELADQGVKELDPGGPGDDPLRKGSVWGEETSRTFKTAFFDSGGSSGSVSSTVIPRRSPDELIETIKNEEKVCHYLDIPIQHASDAS